MNKTNEKATDQAPANPTSTETEQEIAVKVKTPCDGKSGGRSVPMYVQP